MKPPLFASPDYLIPTTRRSSRLRDAVTEYLDEGYAAELIEDLHRILLEEEQVFTEKAKAYRSVFASLGFRQEAE